MLLPPIPPLRRQRRRKADRATPPPPPAPHVTATVAHGGGQSFVWFFSAPFTDPTTPWHPADFAGLLVNGNPPVVIDEIVGVDGTLTLVYDLQDPDAPNLQYEVFTAPAPLHFDGGIPLGVPQNGFVLP